MQFLEGDSNCPSLIAKELAVKEKSALIEGAKVPQAGFSLKLSDIQPPERLAEKNTTVSSDGFLRIISKSPIPPEIKKRHLYLPIRNVCLPVASFRLMHAPGTFQRCMLAIFHDMVEKTMEVFMDDFSVFGNSFQNCLSRLDHMLQRCEDTNLSLNWEKSHFMVKEGIVLGHKILSARDELNKAKIDVPLPITSSHHRQRN
ncbi:reverse transcriptase domain-containing protein [Tanacetum coccineum]